MLEFFNASTLALGRWLAGVQWWKLSEETCVFQTRTVHFILVSLFRASLEFRLFKHGHILVLTKLKLTSYNDYNISHLLLGIVNKNPDNPGFCISLFHPVFCIQQLMAFRGEYF